MKVFRTAITSIIFIIILNSCGVSGDPGHCYISIDWEYYNEDYGVYYYEDNNPEVPDFELIVDSIYYDSYPGEYDYYYESEDKESWYTYDGFYTLIQNPGYSGSLFDDGLNGVDTYVDLYLYIYARKGLDVDTKVISADVIQRKWKQTVGEWTILFEEEVKITPKVKKWFFEAEKSQESLKWFDQAKERSMLAHF